MTLGQRPEVKAAVESYGDLIKAQVLANAISVADNDGTKVEFDDFTLPIKIEKDDK